MSTQNLEDEFETMKKTATDLTLKAQELKAVVDQKTKQAAQSPEMLAITKRENEIKVEMEGLVALRKEVRTKALGKYLDLDPMGNSYPHQSPYFTRKPYSSKLYTNIKAEVLAQIETHVKIRLLTAGNVEEIVNRLVKRELYSDPRIMPAETRQGELERENQSLRDQARQIFNELVGPQERELYTVTGEVNRLNGILSDRASFERTKKVEAARGSLDQVIKAVFEELKDLPSVIPEEIGTTSG